MNKADVLPRVCLVANPAMMGVATMLHIAEAALAPRDGASLVVYTPDDGRPRAEQAAVGRALLALARAARVPLLVRESRPLLRELGCEGLVVAVPGDDAGGSDRRWMAQTLRDVRAAIGESLILAVMVSSAADVTDVVVPAGEGVCDQLHIGPVYSSSTSLHAAPAISIAGIRAVLSALGPSFQRDSLRLVCAGGLDAFHVPTTLRLGRACGRVLDGVAVADALTPACSADPRADVARLRRLVDAARARRGHDGGGWLGAPDEDGAAVAAMAGTVLTRMRAPRQLVVRVADNMMMAVSCAPAAYPVPVPNSPALTALEDGGLAGPHALNAAFIPLDAGPDDLDRAVLWNARTIGATTRLPSRSWLMGHGVPVVADVSALDAVSSRRSAVVAALRRAPVDILVGTASDMVHVRDACHLFPSPHAPAISSSSSPPSSQDSVATIPVTPPNMSWTADPHHHSPCSTALVGDAVARLAGTLVCGPAPRCAVAVVLPDRAADPDCAYVACGGVVVRVRVALRHPDGVRAFLAAAPGGLAGFVAPVVAALAAGSCQSFLCGEGDGAAPCHGRRHGASGRKANLVAESALTGTLMALQALQLATHNMGHGDCTVWGPASFAFTMGDMVWCMGHDALEARGPVSWATGLQVRELKVSDVL